MDAPNCRVAFVAQHIESESHLDISANEYIRWRYANGNDREGLEKTTRIVSKEDEKRMREPIVAEFVGRGHHEKKKAVIKRGSSPAAQGCRVRG
jgi:hypothetical protein